MARKPPRDEECEGIHSISTVMEKSVEIEEPDWVNERIYRRKQEGDEAAMLDIFDKIDHPPITEVFKFWESQKQKEFFFEDFDPLSSDEESKEEKDDAQPLTKKQKIANRYREQIPGLTYIKFFLHGKNLQPFDYEGYKLHNIVDIYALRKRLYTMKDIERADFETLLGNNFSEFNFGGEADLDFHSNYDSGNLFSAIKGNDGVYYLEMMPDTNSVGHFKWFHFTVSRTEKGKHQTFRIMNFRKPDLLAKCIYYKSKKDDKKKETGWQPLNSKCSYFSNSENPDRIDELVRDRCRPHHTLEFSYEFGYNDDQVSFALTMPYTYEDLNLDSHGWAHSVKKEKHFFFRKKLLCYSLMGRKVYYFEIYKSEEKLKSANIKNKKIIVVCARVHPGEACSSFVLKGLVEEVLNLKSRGGAEFLRDHFLLVVVPMLNPDGVSIGNARCSFSGNDLNQCWGNPDRFVHPEVYYTKKLILKFKKENEIVFFADIHGSYSKKGAFVYGCNLQSNQKASREFPALLEHLMNNFEPANCNFFCPKDKKEAAHNVLFSELYLNNSFSFQTSTSQNSYDKPLSVEDYLKIGRQFCDSLGIFMTKKFSKSKASGDLRQRTEELWSSIFGPDFKVDVSKDTRSGSPISTDSAAVVDGRRDGKALIEMLKSYSKHLKKQAESTPAQNTLEDLAKAVAGKLGEFSDPALLGPTLHPSHPHNPYLDSARPLSSLKQSFKPHPNPYTKDPLEPLPVSEEEKRRKKEEQDLVSDFFNREKTKKQTVTFRDQVAEDDLGEEKYNAIVNDDDEDDSENFDGILIEMQKESTKLQNRPTSAVNTSLGALQRRSASNGILKKTATTNSDLKESSLTPKARLQPSPVEKKQPPKKIGEKIAQDSWGKPSKKTAASKTSTDSFNYYQPNFKSDKVGKKVTSGASESGDSTTRNSKDVLSKKHSISFKDATEFLTLADPESEEQTATKKLFKISTKPNENFARPPKSDPKKNETDKKPKEASSKTANPRPLDAAGRHSNFKEKSRDGTPTRAGLRHYEKAIEKNLNKALGQPYPMAAVVELKLGDEFASAGNTRGKPELPANPARFIRRDHKLHTYTPGMPAQDLFNQNMPPHNFLTTKAFGLQTAHSFNKFIPTKTETNLQSGGSPKNQNNFPKVAPAFQPKRISNTTELVLSVPKPPTSQKLAYDQQAQKGIGGNFSSKPANQKPGLKPKKGLVSRMIKDQNPNGPRDLSLTKDYSTRERNNRNPQEAPAMDKPHFNYLSGKHNAQSLNSLIGAQKSPQFADELGDLLGRGIPSNYLNSRGELPQEDFGFNPYNIGALDLQNTFAMRKEWTRTFK